MIRFISPTFGFLILFICAFIAEPYSIAWMFLAYVFIYTMLQNIIKLNTLSKLDLLTKSDIVMAYQKAALTSYTNFPVFIDIILYTFLISLLYDNNLNSLIGPYTLLAAIDVYRIDTILLRDIKKRYI